MYANRSLPTKRGEGLARFMELRGRRIGEAAGVLWHSVEGRVLMSVPYQQTLDPEPGEIQKLLRATGGLGVRYPSSRHPELAGGIYLCRNRDYNILSVHARQRSRVRRGMENCEVRPVEYGQLLTEGLRINLDTMERQGRCDAEFGDPRKWKRLVRAAEQCPSIETFGSFVDGKLAAYMMTYREDGWIHILHQMSRQDLLEQNPNHALTFTTTQQAMHDPKIEVISYGLVSLVTTDGLHEYKQRLGYDVVPQPSAMQLHSVLDPILSTRFVLRSVQALRRVLPSYQRIERVESVLLAARAFQSAIGRPGEVITGLVEGTATK